MIEKLIKKYKKNKKQTLKNINSCGWSVSVYHRNSANLEVYEEILQDLEELKKNQKICVVCRNCEEEMYVSLMQREEGTRYRCSRCNTDILVSLGVDTDE